MKIDENMIEQMTEEEQQELIKLIEKQQKKKKKRIAEELVNELREVVDKIIDENIVFDFTGDTESWDYYSSLDIEVQDEGETILLTFYH